MIILYAYYHNTIFMEPIKSRSDSEDLRAYDVWYNKLEAAVHAPKLNITENESSTSLKRLLENRKTVVQLVPRHTHQKILPDALYAHSLFL